MTGTHREVGVRNEIVQRWATRDDFGIMRQLALNPSSHPHPH